MGEVKKPGVLKAWMHEHSVEFTMGHKSKDHRIDRMISEENVIYLPNSNTLMASITQG